MKEIKKYTDIIRYGKSRTEDVLNKGDIISITEKIDGANASFRIDNTNELGVSCYSRNKPLDEYNTLQGFYNWVLNNVIPIKNKLKENYIYFGEWLVQHKVKYKNEAMKRFWLFSIYDIEKEEYVSDVIVLSEAERLNLDHVPYFYLGEFVSFNHLMNFVGKSDLTLEPNEGEGIVVKNINYKDKFGNQCFVKLVSDKFREVKAQKAPKNPNKNEAEKELVMSVLTKPRIEKMLYKLVDEGELKEDFTIEDMGIILRALGGRLYEDIMKEEGDLFKNYEESVIKRLVGKNTPNLVKEILKELGRM